MKSIAVLTSGGDAPGMNPLYAQSCVRPVREVSKFTVLTEDTPDL